MTWGITVAPRMPAARRTDSVPSNCGTNMPPATAPQLGPARRTSRPNAATITPTRTVIVASRRRKPNDWRPRMPKAATPVIRAAVNSGMPKRRYRPSAAPTNSARSVAIAISSAWTQRKKTTGRGNRSRQTSGRFRPVAMPSLALIDWMSMAIRFADSTTHRSM